MTIYIGYIIGDYAYALYMSTNREKIKKELEKINDLIAINSIYSQYFIRRASVCPGAQIIYYFIFEKGIDI